MKRNYLITAIVVALAVTTFAFAQGVGPRPFGRGDGERGDAMRERVATILDLTDAQKAEWEKIQTATHAKVEPLAAQRQANASALRAEMAGEQPNATRVGELMIANRQIAEQMRTLREQSRAQFESILTPEQKAKHDELKSLRESRRHDRPGRPGRGGMGRRGPGAGLD